MTKYCRTCRILDPMRHVCPVLRSEVDPDKDFCSKHTETLDTCDACGVAILKPILVPDGDEWRFLCPDCAKQLNTCSFCKKVNVCAFEDDPSPIPKIVQQKIRQGSMITVTEVMNPERIRQTCEKSCDCFSTEFGCMRQFHYCERMAHVYDDSRSIDIREPEAP